MSEILAPETIELKASLDSQDEAIRRAGQLLVDNGHVDDQYIDSMFEREKSVSTFMGNGVAIPTARETQSSGSRGQGSPS